MSNWTTARIEAALDYADAHDLRGPVANSAHWSLADQLDDPWPDVVTLTGADREADREWHRQRDVAVVAWSSLAGGFLSERISRAEPGSRRGVHRRHRPLLFQRRKLGSGESGPPRWAADSV